MFIAKHLRVSLGNREITPHGRTCLHTAGMGSINGLAGGLLNALVLLLILTHIRLQQMKLHSEALAQQLTETHISVRLPAAESMIYMTGGDADAELLPQLTQSVQQRNTVRTARKSYGNTAPSWNIPKKNSCLT